METDNLYSGSMKFKELRGNQAVFITETPENWRWGATEEEEARVIEDAEFTIDRRFWENLGKPETVVMGFTTEAGWEKHVGPKHPSEPVGGWWLCGWRVEDNAG